MRMTQTRTRRKAALGLIGVLALTAGLAAGCGDDDDDDDAATDTTAAASETTAAPAETTAAPDTETSAASETTAAPDDGGTGAGAAVAIADFAFDPAETDVAAGDTITWTNNDSADHTVTFEDGSADSGPIANGATFEFTFDTAGEYAYRCDIHPSMTGTVVVA
jgi:plastocyanin